MTATLDRLAGQHPEMSAAVAALRALTGAMRECEVTLPADIPSIAGARARLREGVPALIGEPLLHGPGLLRHAELIARRLAEAGLPDSLSLMAVLRRFHQAAEDDTLASIALSGSWDALAPLAARLGVEEDTLVVLLDYSARPALRAGAGSVAEVIAEAPWGRGICPACGAPPLLVELRPDGDQHNGVPRVLRCGRCATAWGVERVRCPHCGERDHHKLGYVHVEGEQEFRRIERCDSCRGYVKALAVLAPLQADALLEEDLATAGLDLIAADRGYHR